MHTKKSCHALDALVSYWGDCHLLESCGVEFNCVGLGVVCVTAYLYQLLHLLVNSKAARIVIRLRVWVFRAGKPFGTCRQCSHIVLIYYDMILYVININVGQRS